MDIEIYNGSGEIITKKLYQFMFDRIGDEYTYSSVRGDDQVDYKNVDAAFVEDKLRPILGRGCEIILSKVKHLGESTSSASNTDEPRYLYSAGYFTDGYKRPGILIIDKEREFIMSISTDNIYTVYNPDIVGNMEELTENVFHVMPFKDSNEGKPASIGLVSYGHGEFYTIDSAINKTDVDINMNYNDDFKETYDKVLKFLDPNNRCSGVVLLHGKPGSGKTTLIRHLITNVPNNYILVTPSIAARFSSPDFIDFMMSHQGCVYVLEDCEQILEDKSRAAFGGGLSTILNMADGIMSDIFSSKFICTYNTELPIDEALVRPGRCYGDYEFGYLSEEKTKRILESKGIDSDGCGEMLLCDIYNYDNTKGNNKKKKIGF